MSLSQRLMPGFECFDIDTSSGARIHGVKSGEGPAVLLLHGHPQTHLTWHRVAPRLVEAGFAVVATDLRGYGDSSRPPGGENHANYSKRTMALDQIDVMHSLGHERFAVIGHDRGARVAHRMALDHAGALRAIAVLDIAPTATMYARTNKEFATRYFWWFFLIQRAPLPERLIEADPEFFLKQHLGNQSRAGGTDEELFREYLRCYRLPGTIHAICEDYRAAATIDLEHDAVDAGRLLPMPLLALWGAKGVVGSLYDVAQTWCEKAAHVQAKALDCGHVLQEELPDETGSQLLAFLRGALLTQAG